MTSVIFYTFEDSIRQEFEATITVNDAADDASPEYVVETETGDTRVFREEDIICLTNDQDVYIIQDWELFMLKIAEPDILMHFLEYQTLIDWTELDNGDNHILVSTKAGKCDTDLFYNDVISPLLHSMGLEELFTVHLTKSATHISEITRDRIGPDARAGKKQYIILLSGDGGIVDIVNELLDPCGPNETQISPGYVPPTIGLIPLGTGNALAHSTKIFDSTHGLRSLFRGAPRDLPLMRVEFPRTTTSSHPSASTNGEIPSVCALTNEGRDSIQLTKQDEYKSYYWAAVVVSWAFHAQIVADSDTAEYRKHGSARFGMAANEALFPADGGGPHRFLGRVTAELKLGGAERGVEWKAVGNGEHSYILLTLSSHLEASFTVSPRSKPFSPQLRLVRIPHLADGDSIMRLMKLGYDGGKHVKEPEVEYLEVEAVGLTVDEEHEHWRRLCIDGTIFVVRKGVPVVVRAEGRVPVQVLSLVGEGETSEGERDVQIEG